MVRGIRHRGPGAQASGRSVLGLYYRIHQRVQYLKRKELWLVSKVDAYSSKEYPKVLFVQSNFLSIHYK